jgi:hypothetical protein
MGSIVFILRRSMNGHTRWFISEVLKASVSGAVIMGILNRLYGIAQRPKTKIDSLEDNMGAVPVNAGRNGWHDGDGENGHRGMSGKRGRDD